MNHVVVVIIIIINVAIEFIVVSCILYVSIIVVFGYVVYIVTWGKSSLILELLYLCVELVVNLLLVLLEQSLLVAFCRFSVWLFAVNLVQLLVYLVLKLAVLLLALVGCGASSLVLFVVQRTMMS